MHRHPWGKENFWEKDNCENVHSYYSVYPVPTAAALWCGVPPDQVEQRLKESVEIHRAIYQHPYIKCLEPRCRALHEAIKSGALPVSRETGEAFDGSQEHVAPERRHVSRKNLKDWISREFPSDKPDFLFDEIERKAHSAVTLEAYQTLVTERDALKTRLEKTTEALRSTREEKESIEGERNSLRQMVEQSGPTGERSEKTYQLIIGALLSCMHGEIPSSRVHPSFPNETHLIEAILSTFERFPGLSERTLRGKFSEAKKALQSI